MVALGGVTWYVYGTTQLDTLLHTVCAGRRWNCVMPLHGVHCEAGERSRSAVPAGQLVQTVVLPGEYVPAAHGEQGVPEVLSRSA